MKERFPGRWIGRTPYLTALVLAVAGLWPLHTALLADGWSLSSWTWPKHWGNRITLRFVWRNRRAATSLTLTRSVPSETMIKALEAQEEIA